MDKYTTEQELFWKKEFNDGYIERNKSHRLFSAATAEFSRILKNTNNVKSIMELGCNIGLNLMALKQINNDFKLSAVEINTKAIEIARENSNAIVTEDTILNNLEYLGTYDLVFTRGVLIHINPDKLHLVYENLVKLSKRYILVSEYYNPTPVAIPYRGEENKLFKRDFAGELMDNYNLRLVDYGFSYQRDNVFGYSDTTYFLLEKKSEI